MVDVFYIYVSWRERNKHYILGYNMKYIISYKGQHWGGDIIGL